MKKLARQQLAARKNDDILSNEDLEQVQQMLQDASDVDMEMFWISYEKFKQVRQTLPSKFKEYLRAQTFLSFKQNEKGQIDMQQLFSFILRRASLIQERVCISLYDVDGLGLLTEEQLEKYLQDLMPSFPQLEKIEPEFRPFYLCAAVRKFFFFLEGTGTLALAEKLNKSQLRKNGKRIPCVAITDVLLSPILSEFFELQQPDISNTLLLTNWFSLYSTMKVYGQYVEIDSDRNGMLSVDELYQFAKGRYNKVFIDRIYQECVTYAGELDYRSYLNFVLALNDITSPASMAYMFKLLDIHNKQVLDRFTVHYFLKGQVDRIAATGTNGQFLANFKIQQFATEIFDMVHPSVFECISQSDLKRSGVGGQVINLLIDSHLLLQNQFKD